MDLFYTPDIKDKTYIFSKEESKHCIKVLRKVNNDTIYLTDGKGNLYETNIQDDNPNHCTVKVNNIKSNYNKRPYNIHIAISPTKSNTRLEWFLEKVTELGIDEITPIICQNSERKHINIERLNKVLISAMKQSLKTYLPRLNNITSWSDFIKKEFEESKFIAHCRTGSKTPLKQWVKPNQNTLILIGPEGDFIAPEIDTAINQGFIPVELGKSRLRTETAGVVACHTINLINQ